MSEEKRDRLGMILELIRETDADALFIGALLVLLPILIGGGFLFAHIFDKLVDHGWNSFVCLAIGTGIGYSLSYVTKKTQEK